MTSSPDKSLTIVVPANLAGQGDKPASATGGNRTTITRAALRSYLDANAWQIQDSEESIAEADRGELASATEVNAFFANMAL